MGYRSSFGTASLRTVCQLFVGVLGVVIVTSTNAASLYGGFVSGTFDIFESCVPPGNCFYNDVPSIGTTLILGGLGGTSASADYQSGQLGLQATASSGASAAIWDTVTFSGALPGATATITMSGNTDGGSLAGSLLLPYDSDTVVNQWELCYFLHPEAPAECAIRIPGFLSDILSNPAWSIGAPTYVFPISEPGPYFFEAALFTEGCSGNPTCFITDPLTLTLPPGVTFTSASGLFEPTVPEPATLALLALGLAGLGFSRRKH